MPIIPAIGQGGLPCLDLSNRHGTARIYRHGAHVTSWCPTGGSEVLWMSSRSWFEAGKPIRGGIPVCFPWFGGHPTDKTKPAHGFARLRRWDLLRQQEGNETEVVLGLGDDADSRALWPHAFRAELSLRLGPALTVALSITNTGSAPITFSEALHTYLGVADIATTTVDGLQGGAYDDRAGGGSVARVDDAPRVSFTAETDRLYCGQAGPHVVDDGQRRIRVAKDGAKSTVVWNPWIAKAAAMPDYGDREWPGMVCVEAANAAADSVTLAAGATHRCATVLTLC